MKPLIASLGAMAIMTAAPARATDIKVSVNAFATRNDPATGASYVLIPQKDISANGLEYQEYSACIEKVLKSKGLNRVTDIESADFHIAVSFGIGEPRDERVSYSIPIWSPPTSITPYGTTTWVPSDENSKTYHRWLSLSAIAHQNGKEIWRVNVDSTGTVGDLREIFPYLVLASAPYVGVDTGRAVGVKIKKDGKEIRAFLGSESSTRR